MRLPPPKINENSNLIEMNTTARRSRRSRKLTRFVRDPQVPLVISGRELLVIGSQTVAMQIGSVNSALQILERLMAPMNAGEVGTESRELVDGLLQAGALRDLHAGNGPLRARSMSGNQARQLRVASGCGHLVVIATGAVHSVMLPLTIHVAFARFSGNVEVVLTKGARKFVTEQAVRAMGAVCWSNTFDTRATVPHMKLAGSDLLVVYPASAGAISRLACGTCSDLASLTVAATKSPVMVVPAMNTAIWDAPAVSRNVRQLIDDGHYIVVPTMMHEVSEIRHADPVYGGTGTGPANLCKTMGSVLSHHRSRSGRQRGGSEADLNARSAQRVVGGASPAQSHR